MSGRADAKLSEKDAWAIAMAWQEELQGKVRLVVDREGPVTSIMESYAWISMDPPHVDLSPATKQVRYEYAHRDRLIKQASITRAAALTWLALWACPGYSGQENPVFWKRVFSELEREPDPSKHRRGRLVPVFPPATDSIGFFDQPGHVLPRFMVKVVDKCDANSFRTLMQWVCLASEDALTPEVATKLEDLLAQVRPYLDSTGVLSQQTVDVCVCTEQVATYNISSQLSRLAQAVNTAAASGSPFTPTFRIVAVHLDDPMCVGDDADASDVCDLLAKTPVRFGDIVVKPSGLLMMTTASQINWVSALLGREGHINQATTTSLSLRRQDMEDSVFGAFLSALPFARSPHTLKFTAQNFGSHSFEKHDLPWLAYAIFHPEAKKSSWRHLELHRPIWGSHAVAAIEAMSRGNNLAALLNATKPTSDAYYRAVLPKGTSVKLTTVKYTETIISESEDVWVDVCGVTSLDVGTWSEWVSVVVAAHGLMLVRSVLLRDVQAFAPSSSALTGLSISPQITFQDSTTLQQAPELLARVLPYLGVGLTYLDIAGYQDTPAKVLGRILHVCPSLQTLVVNHNGALFWSLKATDPDWLNCSPLQELDIGVTSRTARIEAPSVDHLKSSLGLVRAVRLRLYEPGAIKGNHHLVHQFLVLDHTIHYARWQENRIHTTKHYDPLTCTEDDEWAATVRRQLILLRNRWLASQSPRAAAFLRVIADKIQFLGAEPMCNGTFPADDSRSATATPTLRSIDIGNPMIPVRARSRVGRRMRLTLDMKLSASNSERPNGWKTMAKRMGSRVKRLFR